MATVFDPALRALMAQTIHVAAAAGVSTQAGDPAYSAATPALARVEPVQKTLYSAAGEELQSEFAIYTEHPISLADRVWLPGDSPGDATKARIPMRVYQGVDEDGSLSHYEVFV